MHALSLDEAPRKGTLGRFLVDAHHITARELLSARFDAQETRSSLSDILVSRGLLTPDELTKAIAAFTATPLISLKNTPPDSRLHSEFDISLLLRYQLTPLRREGGHIHFAITDTDRFFAFLKHLDLEHIATSFSFALPSELMSWLTEYHRQPLTKRASERVPAMESCRTWERPTNVRRTALTAFAILATIAVVLAYPALTLGIFAAWACLTLVISAAMRLFAFVTEMSAEPEAQPPECPPEALPKISVIVPLFKEREIASALLDRLSRLTYPKQLLDVVLAIEENDELTRATINASALPPWMSVVVVPEGRPKTKPRALNYALDFCRGNIIGIWDAEDAPAPDQLEVVARHFHSAPDNLVCLQGVLDYYNSRQNWLARCFTIEYAAWFRLILPGMARMGFAIPLGGTTLFFKRDALEKLGAWDAHNVTEDADLGFRLARHGYVTDVIKTRTGEEANCKPWPWIKQRSRWLKGYMVTYLVHMRAPKKLLRQLGAWRFIGFQAHFVTALSQFILAPVLWSFWLVLFGLPHPLDAFVSREILATLGLSFLAIEIINAIINATAVARPSHRHLLPWVPTMHFYYPLGAIAAYKALYELVADPFYWDKTQHGVSLPDEGLSASGIQPETGHKSL